MVELNNLARSEIIAILEAMEEEEPEEHYSIFFTVGLFIVMAVAAGYLVCYLA